MKEKTGKYAFGILAAAALVVGGVSLAMNAFPAESSSGARGESIVSLGAARQEIVTEENCTLVQTYRFLPCGHQVTRRLNLPDDLIGMDFEKVQVNYPLWEIDTFSPAGVVMRRDENLYCPMHLVLQADEAGRICIFKNVYGDGLACEKETPWYLDDVGEESRTLLREGVAFDGEEELEAWLRARTGA